VSSEGKTRRRASLLMFKIAESALLLDKYINIKPLVKHQACKPRCV